MLTPKFYCNIQHIKGPKPADQQAARSKAGSNELARGGKDEADKVLLGTDLNKEESSVADGLMNKL